MMELPSPKVIMIIAGIVFIVLTITEDEAPDVGLDFELDDDLVLDSRADRAPLQRAPAVAGRHRADGGGGDARGVAVLTQPLAGPCPRTHARLERHAEPDHGDVCRDAGGFWACPAGCAKDPNNRAPYCTVLTGGRAVCRAPSTSPTK